MSTTEMKNDDRFSELKWHRLAEFVIYSDFNRVEFPTSDRHVMRMKERLSDRVTVIAGNVADPQQGSFSVADDRVCCNVAVDVHEMQSAIRVE